MKSDVQVDGIEEVQRNMASLAELYGREVAAALQQGGNLVRSTAIKSIQQKSGGQTVTRSRQGGGTYEHTAAAPGSAPNTDTGRLVQSIQVDTGPRDVFVGSTLHYARDLEFGTRRMDARPWLNPALEQNRRTIQNLIRQATERVSARHGNV